MSRIVYEKPHGKLLDRIVRLLRGDLSLTKVHALATGEIVFEQATGINRQFVTLDKVSADKLENILTFLRDESAEAKEIRTLVLEDVS